MYVRMFPVSNFRR